MCAHTPKRCLSLALRSLDQVIVAPRSNNLLETRRIEGEFPGILSIRESLIKYVFEPAAKDKEALRAAVRKMRQEARASQE